MGGLIAANLLLSLAGFSFAKAEGGTVAFVWQGVALERWLGLAIQVGLLWLCWGPFSVAYLAGVPVSG